MTEKKKQDDAPEPSSPQSLNPETSEAGKSYLGHDAADLAALSAEDRVKYAGGASVPAPVEPTSFDGDVQPPGGHVNDPTTSAVVGSEG